MRAMPSPDLPSNLPIRLTRETDLKSQLGCTAGITVLLVAVAGFAWWAGLGSDKDRWVAYLVGGAFGFFGLLCCVSLIRQILASGIPETVVELSAEPLTPGGRYQICLFQRGPARLKSLNAKLVCRQRTTVPIPNAPAGRPRTRLEERILHDEILIDAAHFRVVPGEVWQETREFSLRPDAPVTSVKNNVEVLWKIEVWGTGYGLASFMHPFLVTVLDASE